MKLIRVGDKIISWDKVSAALSEILHRRSAGATQQEVAAAFGIERTFVSYLEGIGAIRKGRRLALIGFPISNKNEVRSVAEDRGVEFIYLLSEKERREFVNQKSGVELFNEILEMLAHLKEYDAVVVLASDKRVAMIEKILELDVVSIPIGSSPLTANQRVDIAELRHLLDALTAEKEEGKSERDRQRQSWIFKKRSRRRSRVARAKV